ncbi:MAG: AAA family ATPase [Nitrospirae bacterium YQR-1]
MAYTIAFSGKGGTGKTTLAGLTVRYLMEKTGKPILAVDADSNYCLNLALGVEVHATIGGIRESSLESVRLSGQRPGGMSTGELFDYQVQQSIVEARGFDLLVMGRPEGPGCYCAANNVIRKYTDKLAQDYAFVVIDAEAGMEHLSRRTENNVDIMFTITDATVKALETAKRISALMDELGLKISERHVIVNRVREAGSEELKKEATTRGLSVCGFLPEDDGISTVDLLGKPVFDIAPGAPVLTSFYSLLGSTLKY